MKPLLAKFADLRVLVAGDVMLDHYVWGDVRRISPEAPVPVVEVERDTHTAGGAANVALNVRALGARCELCGWIAQDDAGLRLSALLARSGVEFDPAAFPAPCPTIVKTRVVVRRQQLCRLDREVHVEAPDYGPGLDRLAAKVAAADAVVLSDYAKGFLSDRLVTRVQQAARGKGAVVALDPKPVHPLRADGLDLLTPNRRESMQLAGLPADAHGRFPAAEVCRRIWERHRPRHLVVTMGEDGMLLSEKGRITARIPTIAREVFDVSGAGDTVVAVLTMALAAGAGLEEAAHLANAAAGVVIAKVGTATATPKEIVEYDRAIRSEQAHKGGARGRRK